jgi:hypothetical protein
VQRDDVCSTAKIEFPVGQSKDYSRVIFCSDDGSCIYRGADKSLARPTSRCILFDGQNISFDASLSVYIYSTNTPPIMIIIRIYET